MGSKNSKQGRTDAIDSDVMGFISSARVVLTEFRGALHIICDGPSQNGMPSSQFASSANGQNFPSNFQNTNFQQGNFASGPNQQGAYPPPLPSAQQDNVPASPPLSSTQVSQQPTLADLAAPRVDGQNLVNAATCVSTLTRSFTNFSSSSSVVDPSQQRQGGMMDATSTVMGPSKQLMRHFVIEVLDDATVAINGLESLFRTKPRLSGPQIYPTANHLLTQFESNMTCCRDILRDHPQYVAKADTLLRFTSNNFRPVLASWAPNGNHNYNYNNNNTRTNNGPLSNNNNGLLNNSQSSYNNNAPLTNSQSSYSNNAPLTNSQSGYNNGSQGSYQSSYNNGSQQPLSQQPLSQQQQGYNQGVPQAQHA